MNKQQREVQQAFLDSEKEVLNKLKKNYQDALNDINSKIELLMSRQDADMSHVIYQVEYQKALKKQVQGILDTLQANEFETVSEYLAKSYEDGFIGTMYDIQGQGIPVIMPMDQEQIVKAIQHETKLSTKLYDAFDIKDLQKQIASEISRGISTGMMFPEIARNISNYAGISRNKAMRIARTEGHRIQCKATMDAQFKAKEKGADVVKQWDSTLDKRTRASHRRVDGEIRELDEPFSNGLMFPGDPDGGASEVVNCRCALLQRARWALNESELETLKKRAEYFDLDKAEDFADYKKKYLKAVEEETKPVEHTEAYKYIMQDIDDMKVKYNEVHKLDKALSHDEIIQKLSGGDMTSGSCASVALAYVGNKIGLDVTDFRGGDSREIFGLKRTVQKLAELDGVKAEVHKVEKELLGTMNILKNLEQGKEYYLSTGKHASIIRRTDAGVEYLELQSKNRNGWMSFEAYGSMAKTLEKRFGCRKTVDKLKLSNKTVIYEKQVTLLEVDSFKDNDEFKELLGYINTTTNKQKKGEKGDVK